MNIYRKKGSLECWAQWCLAGTPTPPTTHPSQHHSPCSVDVSLPTCLPRWAVSSVGSIYPVSPVPEQGQVHRKSLGKFC